MYKLEFVNMLTGDKCEDLEDVGGNEEECKEVVKMNNM
jgi:hypothetical protein